MSYQAYPALYYNMYVSCPSIRVIIHPVIMVRPPCYIAPELLAQPPFKRHPARQRRPKFRHERPKASSRQAQQNGPPDAGTNGDTSLRSAHWAWHSGAPGPLRVLPHIHPPTAAPRPSFSLMNTTYIPATFLPSHIPPVDQRCTARSHSIMGAAHPTAPLPCRSPTALNGSTPKFLSTLSDPLA